MKPDCYGGWTLTFVDGPNDGWCSGLLCGDPENCYTNWLFEGISNPGTQCCWSTGWDHVMGGEDNYPPGFDMCDDFIWGGDAFSQKCGRSADYVIQGGETVEDLVLLSTVIFTCESCTRPEPPTGN